MPFTAINLTRSQNWGSERLANLFMAAQLVSSEPEFKFSLISKPLYVLNPHHAGPQANIWMYYIFSHTLFYFILMAT